MDVTFLLFLMSMINVTVRSYEFIKNPVITTPFGAIKGTVLKDDGDNPIYSFIGVRYAKPPVGKLQFQPPQPIDSWNGTYEATQNGMPCPKPKEYTSNEDCLFLSVYTTKLPHDHQNTKRPVIVIFHPESYIFGKQNNFELTWYLKQGAIAVTINYRLASASFTTSVDKLSPGIQDQVVALKWVKRNINAFGGDSNLITVAVYNVDGFRTSVQLLTEKSNGAFMRIFGMH